MAESKTTERQSEERRRRKRERQSKTGREEWWKEKRVMQKVRERGVRVIDCCESERY